MAIAELSTLSTEFVHVPVTITLAGAALTPSVPPKLAFLAASTDGGPIETDWYVGEWSGPTARLMIGPEGGARTLDPGAYAVWITFTAGAETPVCRAGYIRVY